MKRARIKAMVSVPPRRKVTQDTSVTETVNVIECDEKNKSKSDDTCLVLQETPENDSQEKQVEENLAIIEQTQSEQLRHNKQDTQCEDESKQNSDESRKETTQSSENLNTTQIVTPIKSAQCRVGYIRPTPKLDSGGRVRRNSIQGSGASASESEDDSRRVNCATINHTRNDLIHSAESVKDTIANNTKNLQKSKIGQKRRILVSESARKLAEARREFHIKHENKTPDRTKLTMYDLIYYNPITNPMKRSKESGMVARKISECQSEEIQEEEEENVDDPSSAMPVPQVKVGPDGQLIIDEQSLVIEQTNAKKGKEVLSKDAVVDDDNNGSGFYKKRQKSKEWTKWETLKFYKALNTVGTDFLLMQSLFPNRTRQEIKLKFKKEEKVNRNLVEKALAYHQEFDTDMLEKSLATFESSEKEHSDTLEKRKLQRPAEKKKFKISKKRKCRIVATSIAEMDASDEEENCLEFMVQNENLEKEQCEEVFNKTNKRSHKGSREEVKILEKSSIEIDDVQSLSVYNGFDSDSEVYHVRPTRSGRLPKVKKLQGPDINTLDNEILNYGSIDHETITSPKDDLKIANNLIIDNINTNQETQCTSSVKTVIPNIDNVEPGSLVILSKESPEEPGKSVLQVYMVSSNINSSQTLKESNITSVNLPPELLATVSTKLSDAESITVKQEYE
ncbi:transcription factor TFIIIB component B'' homolog isoform X1 [Colletes gigas]|uniref:transcription factor TFIIIB component B'' homolog isoform X1 n=1 Tax=Colletes gigas TaxID=935657 RepID=UPI001C9AABED|nr:transcription factor TFIIIB component B'' homolog isoform X1 [Colletes gigas]